MKRALLEELDRKPTEAMLRSLLDKKNDRTSKVDTLTKIIASLEEQLVAAKEQNDTNSKELAIISKEVIGFMKQLNLTQEQVEQQIPKTPESGVSKPQRPHSKTPSRSGSAIRKRAAEDLEDKIEGDEDSKMHPPLETPTAAPSGGMNPAPMFAANLAGQEQGAQPAGSSHGGGQVSTPQRGQHTLGMAFTAAAKKKKQAEEQARRAQAAAQIPAPEEHVLEEADPATDYEQTIAEREAAEAADDAGL